MLGQLEFVHSIFEQGKYSEAAKEFEKLITEHKEYAENPLVRYNLA